MFSLCCVQCTQCDVTCLVVCTAGEGLAWQFVKYHMLRHLINHILLFGWIENSSCQAGEHCHKFYLKLIKRLTNNKEDWERQVFNVHTRDQAIQNIIAEISMYLLHYICLVCPVY